MFMFFYIHRYLKVQWTTVYLINNGNDILMAEKRVVLLYICADNYISTFFIYAMVIENLSYNTAMKTIIVYLVNGTKKLVVENRGGHKSSYKDICYSS